MYLYSNQPLFVTSIHNSNRIAPLGTRVQVPQNIFFFFQKISIPCINSISLTLILFYMMPMGNSVLVVLISNVKGHADTVFKDKCRRQYSLLFHTNILFLGNNLRCSSSVCGYTGKYYFLHIKVRRSSVTSFN